MVIDAWGFEQQLEIIKELLVDLKVKITPNGYCRRCPKALKAVKIDFILCNCYLFELPDVKKSAFKNKIKKKILFLYFFKA